MFFIRARSNPRLLRPTWLLSGVSAALAASHFFLSHPEDALPLSPSRFTPTTLVESVDVSSNSKLFTLSVPPELLPREPAAFVPIWSFFVKDSDIQVERPYTPLEGIDENGRIKLWIKKYEHGEVSRWLHSRKVGDPIEIRGPVPTWSRSWQDGHWDQVILISGGTGITPFFQLLHSVFRTHDSPFDPQTRFTLLHGTRTLADIPTSMMQSLVILSQKYPDRFQMGLFAESVDASSENHLPHIHCGRIGKSAVQDALQLTHSAPWWRRLFGWSVHTPFPPEKRVLVLVCGPEGMVSAIAGPYGRNHSQGEVGGILGELGLTSPHVWKL